MSAIKGWERKNFNELGICIRGVSYKPNDLQPAPAKENVTLLRSNNIRDGRLNYDNLQFVNQSVVREHQKLQNEDIAICMSNGNRALVGKSGKFVERGDNAEYTVGAFCSIFRPANGFDAGYIRHLFGSEKYQKQLDGILAGSAINNLKGSDIDGLIAFCPTSKSEQTKIIEILSTVDRAIEQTDALIAKQQRIKTALMQDLLTRGIDEHGNLRSEQTHEFKDSPLGRIPVEWSSLQIGIVATLQRGHDITENELYEGPYPVVSSSGVIGYHTQCTSKGPNVVIGRKGTIGKVHYLEHDFWAHDTSLYVTNFRGNNERYIYYLFTHLDLARYGTKSGSPSLNRNDIHPLWIGLPLPDEQSKIVIILMKCDQRLGFMGRGLEKLRSLKTALMQDLLTGKKRVTPLLNETEVASL